MQFGGGDGRAQAGRGALLLAVVAAHVLFGLWLARRSQPLLPPSAPARIELVLIEPQARSVAPPPSPRPPQRRRVAPPALPVPSPPKPAPDQPPPDEARAGPADVPPVDARTLLRQAAAAARAAPLPAAGAPSVPRLPGREAAFVEGIAVRGTRSPQQWVALVGRLLGAEDPCVDLLRRRVAALDVDEIVDVERRLQRRSCPR